MAQLIENHQVVASILWQSMAFFIGEIFHSVSATYMNIKLLRLKIQWNTVDLILKCVDASLPLCQFSVQ